ncbi:hypothetical protein [Falsiroseomonas sp.]|uniref:hypothetical protein n=1 Tax=Falsiroseomonas sp. TaxID=2870721 RepID=UPI0035676154
MSVDHRVLPPAGDQQAADRKCRDRRDRKRKAGQDRRATAGAIVGPDAQPSAVPITRVADQAMRLSAGPA